MAATKSIPRFSGSEKLYREQAAFHAYSTAMGPVDELTRLWSGDAPAPKRRLNRRRGRPAKEFREPNGARLVRRLRAHIASGRPLTPPMLAALASLGAIDTNCSPDCTRRPVFADGMWLPAIEDGEVIRSVAAEGAEARQLDEPSLTTLRSGLVEDLDWRSVVRQRAREIGEFRRREITVPSWAASEERAALQSRSPEETHRSSRCAAWLRRVARFLLRRVRP